MGYLRAIGMGAVAGLRAMSAPAFVSHRLSREDGNRIEGPLALMADPRVAAGFKVLAAGEALADKTPWIPNRTAPPGLLGRFASGALVGAALAAREGERPEVGGALGALAALGATYTAFYLRRELARRLPVPDPLLGVVEDLCVAAISRRVLDTLEPGRSEESRPLETGPTQVDLQPEPA